MDQFLSHFFDGRQYDNNGNPLHGRETSRSYDNYLRRVALLHGREGEELLQEFRRYVGLYVNYAGAPANNELSQTAVTGFFFIELNKMQFENHYQNNLSAYNVIFQNLSNLPNDSSDETRGVVPPQNPGVDHGHDLNGRNMHIYRYIPHENYYKVLVTGRNHRDRMLQLNEAVNRLLILVRRRIMIANNPLPRRPNNEEWGASSRQNVQQTNNSGLFLI